MCNRNASHGSDLISGGCFVPKFIRKRHPSQRHLASPTEWPAAFLLSPLPSRLGPVVLFTGTVAAALHLASIVTVLLLLSCIYYLGRRTIIYIKYNNNKYKKIILLKKEEERIDYYYLID